VFDRAEATRLLADAGVPDDRSRRLVEYVLLLLEANTRLNLTAARSAAEAVAHVLDSLTLIPYAGSTLVDVGSGGGFPAIPLAIASGTRVTLVEATGKKAAFLRRACVHLDLAADVVAERAEVAAHRPQLRGRFDTATARAVASAPAAAELTLPLVRLGGTALLQRGRCAFGEAEALSDATACLGGAVESEYRVGDERRIVVIRKVRETPSCYPRRPGIPTKRPLGGVPRGTPP